jgi:hypothetical protein
MVRGRWADGRGVDLQCLSLNVCRQSERILCLITGAAQHLVHLTPKDFAGNDKRHLKAWEQIMEDLTWADADHKGEGKLHASIKRMIDEDAHRVATDNSASFSTCQVGGGNRRAGR